MAEPHLDALPFARFFEEAVGCAGSEMFGEIEHPDFANPWGDDGALIEDWFAEGEQLHSEEWDAPSDERRAGIARRLR